MFNQIMTLRAGGHVRRYHIKPMIGQQTVAEHTFHMLVLLDVLFPGEPSLALVRAILYHDVPEGVVGDLPAGAKRRFSALNAILEEAEGQVASDLGLPALWELDPADRRWLHMLDSLECAFCALDQIQLGNQHFRSVFRSGLTGAELRYDDIWANEPSTALPERRDHLLFNLLHAEAARLGI